MIRDSEMFICYFFKGEIFLKCCLTDLQFISTATPDGGSCTFNVTEIAQGAMPCAKHPNFGLVSAAGYLLFSNVLLLNLLIAMFRYGINGVCTSIIDVMMINNFNC